MSLPTVPPTWREARDDLGMRVVGALPERLRRSEVGEQASREFPVTATAAGELHWTPVIAVGDRTFPVTPRLLEWWSTDARTAVDEAFAASHRRIAADRFTLRSIGPGCWRTDDVEHPAWLLRSDVARAVLAQGFRTAGDPVLLVATTGSALLAGADDPAGLALLAASAAQDLRDHPLAAASVQPLRWRDAWTPFAWPTGDGARRRDRKAFAQLAVAAEGLGRAFDDAGAAIAQVVGRDGLSVPPMPARSGRDRTVPDGWADLALALGATAESAADVRSAAADPLAWYDSHARRLRGGFDFLPERDEFRPEHALVGGLATAGVLLDISRHSDPRALEIDVAATPAARTVGLRPVLADDHDSAMDLAEDVAAQVQAAGLHLVTIGDGGDALWVVPVTEEQSAQVDAAVRKIGDHALLNYL